MKHPIHSREARAWRDEEMSRFDEVGDAGCVGLRNGRCGVVIDGAIQADLLRLH